MIRWRPHRAKSTDVGDGGNDHAAAFARARRRLVAEIVADVRRTGDYLGKRALDARVIEAMERVPRHEFVPESERRLAYDNAPLPIGYGQTISQPLVVAVMTDALDPRPTDTVLEIGAGSGYQTAVLAEIVRRVYSLEVVAAHAEAAAGRLARLGYDNVEVRAGDGAFGWPEHAPFDGILVSAAAPEVPPALIDQLAPGRRIVIPVGVPGYHQDLTLIEKHPDGTLSRRVILPVAFVPMIGMVERLD